MQSSNPDMHSSLNTPTELIWAAKHHKYNGWELPDWNILQARWSAYHTTKKSATTL